MPAYPPPPTTPPPFANGYCDHGGSEGVLPHAGDSDQLVPSLISTQPVDMATGTGAANTAVIGDENDLDGLYQDDDLYQVNPPSLASIPLPVKFDWSRLPKKASPSQDTSPADRQMLDKSRDLLLDPRQGAQGGDEMQMPFRDP